MGCVLVPALPGLMCTPEGWSSISVTQESLSVLMTEVEGGITIENLGVLSAFHR